MKRVFFLIALALLSAQATADNAPPPPAIENASKTVPEDPDKILREEALEESQDSSFYKEFLNMLMTLFFLLALLFAFSYFLRRMNLSRVKYANQASNIKILDQRALSSKSALFVVEYKGKEFFIGETQNSMTLLHSQEGAVESEPEPKKFPD